MKRVIRRFRVQASLVALLTLTVNAGMVYWGWTFYRDLGLLNIGWHHNSQLILEKASHLANVERAFGYAGFIHNFKNYVLRRTSVYEARADQSLDTLLESLDALEGLRLTQEDRRDLAEIRYIVEEYQLKFLDAKKNSLRGLSPEELDSLVSVDDAPAAASFRAFRERLIPSYRAALADHNSRIMAVWKRVATSAVAAVPIIVLNCLVCFWLISRLVRHKDEEIFIFSGSTDAILVCDEAGRIAKANPAASEIFGYREHELYNMHVLDVIPGLDMASFARPEEERSPYARQQAQGVPVQGKTKVGTDIPLAISVSSVRILRRAASMVVVRRATLPAT